LGALGSAGGADRPVNQPLTVDSEHTGWLGSTASWFNHHAGLISINNDLPSVEFGDLPCLLASGQIADHRQGCPAVFPAQYSGSCLNLFLGRLRQPATGFVAFVGGKVSDIAVDLIANLRCCTGSTTA